MMFSLHYFTYAVCLALIAVLVWQYIQLKSEYERLKDKGRPLYLNQSLSEAEVKYDGNLRFQSETISKSHNRASRNTAMIEGTSVWCSSNKESNRICQFKDLCYRYASDEFLFFLGDGSIFENFNQSDAGTLGMSSIDGHNMHFAKIVFLPGISSQNFSLNWINQTSLIFSRFKADNLMHVFHDDIIPMHHTLQLLELSSEKHIFDKFNIQLAFFDDWKGGDFDFLYELFTRNKSIHKTDLEGNDVTCFRKAYLGISKTTVWYDYGFHHPQAPVEHIKASSSHIRRTFYYISDKLNISTELLDESPYLVMVSRTTNRQILNEFELAMSLIRETGMRILTVNLERQDFEEVLRIISQSVGLIGVHGSLLILMLALKPGSILIELYPYAINPQNYTPYRTLSTLPGMDIVYKAWSNKNPKDTVGHPDWSSHHGGIGHLPESQQIQIVKQTDVPKHLCCDDPSWLYHIFQDTKVDIPTVTQLVLDSLKEADALKKEFKSELKVPPSAVTDIHCRRVDASIQLSWKPPWNLPYIQNGEMLYEVIRKYGNDEDNVLYLIKDTKYKMVDSKPNEEVHIWIRCVLDHQYSAFVYVNQCLNT